MNKVHLQETKDYKQFKQLLGNRNLDRFNMFRLTKSIARKNLLPYAPIIVNEKMEVIDGQHRLEVAKQNDLPIAYVVAPGLNLDDIQWLNTAKAKWSMTDYLHSFVVKGKPDYLLFAEFVEEHKISTRVGLAFAKKDQGTSTVAFKAGRLLFDEAAHEKAEYRINAWETIKPFFLDTSYYHMEFIRALIDLCDRELFPAFLEKLKVSGKALFRRGSRLDYTRFFEDTINWRKQGNRVSLTS